MEIKSFLKIVHEALNGEVEVTFGKSLEDLESLVELFNSAEQLKSQNEYLKGLIELNIDPEISFKQFIEIQRDVISTKTSEIIYKVEHDPIYSEKIIEYGDKLKALKAFTKLLDDMVEAFNGIISIMN